MSFRLPGLARERAAQAAALLRSLVHADAVAPARLLVAGPTGRITHEEAQRLDYRPASIGEAFGPLWATYWFRVEADVPAAWSGARVDLLWNSNSEALLWRDGQPASGLSAPVGGTRQTAVLLDPAAGGERLALEVEVACNSLFGDPSLLGEEGWVGALAGGAWSAAPTPGPGQGAARRDAAAFLQRVAIARLDRAAWDLLHDLEVVRALELEAEHGRQDPGPYRGLPGAPRIGLDAAWAGRLLGGMTRFCAELSIEDRATWPAARAILQELLQSRNGTTAHTVVAMGHAHLDSAWLWPVAESRRKFVRTAASQLALLERHPELRFACSSAQHYAWLAEDQPELFARVRAAVEAGGWVPVGGSWVEPDCNLPSGESLVRQLLHGQRFFERELGRRCREFWNPDVFGLTPQLPQLLRGAGIDRVLLQKHANWNRFTPPPAHSFRWAAPDGSEVLVHTSPHGTYNGVMAVRELRNGAAAYLDADRSSTSMYLFGFGDGGGGPTEEMLERGRRLADLQEVPRVRHATSDELFTRLAEELDAPVRVTGELELQAHRGTYTTQAAIKRGVRRAERALQEADAATALTARAGGRPPGDAARARLGRLWRTLLLHQFHDILPGSSIGEVNAEAREALAALERDADLVVAEALGDGDPQPVNLGPFARREVVAQPSGELVLVDCPPYGAGVVAPPRATVVATARDDADGGGWTLDNGVLRATLDAGGSVVSLVEHGTGREALAGPIGLELHEDRPTEFDAWEIDPFDLASPPQVPHSTHAALSTATPLRAEVTVEVPLGERSRLRQTIRLDAEARALEFHVEADWHERHRLLRARIPTTARADSARFESAFGVVERPTHRSRPRDWAQFEVPGHRFAGLEEPGFGVAVLTDSKYGYSAHGGDLRISLLRGPTDPDPETDQGRHAFAYAVLPHPGAWHEHGVVRAARCFNQPLRWAAAPRGGAACDDPHLVLDTIKPAEDGDATVLRLYEAHGARGTATIRLDPPARAALRATLLEEPGEALEITPEGAVTVPYRPHEVITVLLPGTG